MDLRGHGRSAHPGRRLALADHPLTWMNLAELGSICLTPFTTSLLGNYPSQPPAELAYGANLTAIGVMH